LEFARSVVASTPLSIAAVKRVFDDCAELPESDAFRLQDEILATVLQSQNAQEAPRVFAEKRPRWEGRCIDSRQRPCTARDTEQQPPGRRLMTELVVLNLAKREIQAVSLDGSRVRTLVRDLDETPDGVVADPQRGHIYWTNMGAPDPGATPGTEPSFFTRNGSIERVDFDGGNRCTIVPRGAFTTGKQLTADFADGKLYWCDREGMQVLRCDLDGSNLQTLIVAGVGEHAARDARNHPVGVAVDPNRRMIYWSQKGAPNAGEGRIFRAPIDIPPGRNPADRDDIELLWAGLPEPIDLDLDATGMLVWTDRGDPPEGNTLNRARVEPAIGRREICSRGYQEAIGMSTADGVTYYVGDLAGGHIRAVNLSDGTERELITLGPGLTGLALADLQPAATRKQRPSGGVFG
jgi:hypothetical protein